ncbi:hypothetical protein A2U06_08010 [Fusobacterium necrophorum subsp. funduliforme]|uniref:Uncharacterized protein n=2 Tax=Fusobacterium TaxID=848 RepID=E5BFH4_9FUSO|nr:MULTISPECIES: hypothetical protein [Fusobacterium]EFS20855.1 hypothetical protein FSBG_00352 [Fusobacterium gonidiaformans 3-1-5R]KXA11782.1 hypothetical protein HMPREF3206_01885 [Fusobacterium equinum]KYM55383.1 hypothetical protein A2U06_08010 [Fusobacterium necrophorum subsp. funduliforme]
MTKLESTKKAICGQLGIKNREMVEEKLNSLAIDMLKRKNFLKKMNMTGKKNIEELSEKYTEITGRIIQKIKEINGIL